MSFRPFPIFVSLFLSFATALPWTAHSEVKKTEVSRKNIGILSKNNEYLTLFSSIFLQNGIQKIDYWKENIPVSLNYFYDGAVWDRFPRNPKTDPELGAPSTPCVRLQVDFILADPLPQGPVSFFTANSDGPLLPLGQGTPESSGSSASSRSVLLDPVPDLWASRVRTSFRPQQDGTSAEETFRIDLYNDSPSPKTVLVREHALRGTNVQVVAAGQECEIRQNPGKNPELLFPVRLSPSSSRTVSYTVKYQW